MSATPTPALRCPPATTTARGKFVFRESMDEKLHGQLPHLLDGSPGLPLAVSARHVSLEVDFVPKGGGEDVIDAVPFLAEVVVLLEVGPQGPYVGVEVLLAVTLAEVAPEVELPQVHVEGVFVQEPLVTEATDGVPLVGKVVGVTVPAVSRQLGARVHFELGRKEFEVFYADVTVVKVVDFVDVFSELPEVSEGRLVMAHGTPVVQDITELVIQIFALKIEVMPPINGIPILILKTQERSHF